MALMEARFRGQEEEGPRWTEATKQLPTRGETHETASHSRQSWRTKGGWSGSIKSHRKDKRWPVPVPSGLPRT